MQIRNMFHDGKKTERRILVKGRWVRPDPQAAIVLSWLKSGVNFEVASRPIGAR